MNQLTTTNNQFTVETLMQKVFEASGYQFTIITPNDSEPHFIAREVSDALGYSKSFTLSQYFDDKLIITKENGLASIRDVLPSIGKFTSKLALIPASSLQEFLLRRSDLSKAKEIGNIIYDYFTKPKTLVEEPINPFKDLLKSEAERLGLSKEYQSWYWEYVDGIYWFEKRDYRANIINGVKCMISCYNTLEGRFMTTLGKNSAKKILKKQGASSKMLSSYLRRWNRSERRYNWLMSPKSWISFLLSLAIKSVQIQFSTETRF